MDASYWDQTRSAVLIAMVKSDPVGFRNALSQRCLVSWLRERAESIDPVVSGISEKALMTVKLDFQIAQETDAEAFDFYEKLSEFPALRLH